MSYKDRLKPLIITTPDGKQYDFAFEDLETQNAKKTTAAEYADVDGQNIQDFGLGKKTWSLTVYFHGPDYDLESARFDVSAGKKGISTFEHPNQGIFKAVILSFNRTDALRSSGNQATYKIDIAKTVIITIPFKGDKTQNQIDDTGNEFEESAIAAFETSFLADTVNLINKAAGRIKAFNRQVRAAVSGVTGAVNDIQNGVSNIVNNINANITTLIQAPGVLAGSMRDLITLPARGLNSIGSRLASYGNLGDYITSTLPSGTGKDYLNDCQERQLWLNMVVRGMCETAILVSIGEIADDTGKTSDARIYYDGEESDLTTRRDAISVATTILEKLYVYRNYIGNLQNPAAALGEQFSIDGNSMRLLANTASLTTREMVRLSFDLKTERIYINPAETTTMQLASYLYGSSESKYRQKLINANGLTGRTLIRVPARTSILYYA